MPADSLEQRVGALEQIVNGPQGLVVTLDRLQSELHDFRADFLQFKDEVRGEFAAVRNDMRAGDEETRAQMRLLHEDVINRLALLQESLNGRGAGKRSRRRT